MFAGCELPAYAFAVHSGGRLKIRAIAGVIGTAVVLGLGVPPAGAEPADGATVADAPVLSLTALGADPTIAFYGAQGVTSLTLPVPPGLVPASLDVVVEMPVNAASGTLTVMQEDRTLSRVPLPNTDRVPISVPLRGAVVTDNAVTVTLRSYLVPIEGYCLDPSNPLRLVDADVRYVGAEAVPTTVAEFLPPVLQRLALFLPAEPTRAETDAAIRMATAVVARYGRQNTVVTVNPLPSGQSVPARPSLPMQRQVVIREDDEAGVELTDGPGVPALLITGPAADLANQTRLLSSDMGRLALSSKAVAGPLRTSPQLPPDVTSLRALGQPGASATALTPQVNIALDQTRLGRPAHHIRVHLIGSYTPLPSSVGGQLVALVGGETIDSWSVDGAGVIDRWIDVPDRLLMRYTNLGVAMNITGNVGSCGEFQPVTLTIDGDSPIESTRANPPVPGGFQSLPQALMPRVEVGMTDGFDDTRRAIGILTGLQRLSALPIDTAVVSVDEALASTNPAVLIEATSWNHNDVTLPVAGNSDGELTVLNADGGTESSTLQLDPALAFGSLQTVYDGRRSLLVATSNGAPAQLDTLLEWLNTDVRRWSNVSGDALISTPNRAPVVVNTAPANGAADQTDDQEQPIPMLVWGIGAAAVVAAGIAVAVMVQRRRKT
ncbi:membrane protein [soil metagenome]